MLAYIPAPWILWVTEMSYHMMSCHDDRFWTGFPSLPTAIGRRPMWSPTTKIRWSTWNELRLSQLSPPEWQCDAMCIGVPRNEANPLAVKMWKTQWGTPIHIGQGNVIGMLRRVNSAVKILAAGPLVQLPIATKPAHCLVMKLGNLLDTMHPTSRPRIWLKHKHVKDAPHKVDRTSLIIICVLIIIIINNNNNNCNNYCYY